MREHLLLYLAAFLFSAGTAIVLTRRHSIMVLLGIELMFNAANLNLAVFSRNETGLLDGQIFALFVIIVAVCEAAVGMAIVLRVYHYYHTPMPDQVNDLKEKH